MECNQCGEKLGLICHKHVQCILCMELVLVPSCLVGAVHIKQGCINCAILPSGMGARGVSSEHVENIENLEMSK